ncbi:hypothetical protein ACIA8R_02415 [Nonomuraea sp. NPDC051191]|uniref:hypothetical protein n=1 Tax=Nonomuraea sp. NPDC051191 TaxID=3364372 RepID=UPI0037ACC332
MFKRRLAVLGTVGVLALAVLGGSALADAPPAPDVPAATTVAATALAASAAPTMAPTMAGVSCRTPDGKEVKFVHSVAARVFVARDEKGERKDGAPAPDAEPGVTVEISPLTTTEAAPTTPSAPAAPEGAPGAPEAAPIAPATPEDAPSATLPEGETVRAVPALPATELPPGAVNADDPSKVVQIVCAQAKPVD